MDLIKNFIVRKKINHVIVYFFVFFVLIIFLLNIILIKISLDQSLKGEMLNRGIVLAQDYSNRFIDSLLIKDINEIVATLINEARTHPEIYYIAITDPLNDGKILASSFVGNMPENIQDLLNTNQKENESVLLTIGNEQTYNSAVRMKYDIGTVNIGFYKKQIDDTIDKTLFSLVFGIIISILVAIVLAFIFSKIILIPIDTLQKVIGKISQGNLDEKIEVMTDDKIGMLAKDFNKMMDEIKNSKKELENSNKNLENQIIDRTKEIQGKVDELERFQVLVVDREVKMIELKRQLKEKDKNQSDS